MIAVHKKIDFINQLNATFGNGGLACSFTDKELIQFISWKRRIFHNSDNRVDKQGVPQLGRQPCGNIWILLDDCFINKEGEISTNSTYIWLRNPTSFVTSTKEISLQEIVCSVTKPLSKTTLPSLLGMLENALGIIF